MSLPLLPRFLTYLSITDLSILAAIAASEPAHYPEMLQEGFELVLGGEAGVGEETINVTPFVETAIIEELEIVGNDEGYNMIG